MKSERMTMVAVGLLVAALFVLPFVMGCSEKFVEFMKDPQAIERTAEAVRDVVEAGDEPGGGMFYERVLRPIRKQRETNGKTN
jgi:hypothetical protein